MRWPSVRWRWVARFHSPLFPFPPLSSHQMTPYLVLGPRPDQMHHFTCVLYTLRTSSSSPSHPSVEEPPYSRKPSRVGTRTSRVALASFWEPRPRLGPPKTGGRALAAGWCVSRDPAAWNAFYLALSAAGFIGSLVRGRRIPCCSVLRGAPRK